jgi:hypothetical protein
VAARHRVSAHRRAAARAAPETAMARPACR